MWGAVIGDIAGSRSEGIRGDVDPPLHRRRNLRQTQPPCPRTWSDEGVSTIARSSSTQSNVVPRCSIRWQLEHSSN